MKGAKNFSLTGRKRTGIVSSCVPKDPVCNNGMSLSSATGNVIAVPSKRRLIFGSNVPCLREHRGGVTSVSRGRPLDFNISIQGGLTGNFSIRDKLACACLTSSMECRNDSRGVDRGLRCVNVPMQTG